MQRIIITAFFTLCGFVSLAQGVGSIFTQQLNKDKLMIAQIALQETYLSEIKTGYKNTKNGLNTAHDLKNGTFNLHQDYFNSLSQVSPAVKNNPKIGLITYYQRQLITSFDNEISWQQLQAILESDEISYIQKVYTNILSACSRDLDELNMIITPGKAQMKDEERIKQIDIIYAATNDKYKFSQSFIQRARSFSTDRQCGKQQSQVVKKLYDIN